MSDQKCKEERGGRKIWHKTSQVINISIFKYSDEICWGGSLVMVIRRRMHSKDDWNLSNKNKLLQLACFLSDVMFNEMNLNYLFYN